MASSFVLPGEQIPAASLPLPSNPSRSFKAGPGLHQNGNSEVYPVLAGTLLTDNRKHAAWLESPGGRYVPAFNDPVIATVQRSAAEAFVCSLTPHTSSVSLPHLAFEGVSRKTRPQFASGALVYARISQANRFLEAEVTCVNPTNGKSEGLGELKGGMIFDVSLGFARRLLVSKQRERGGIGILEDLAEKIAFEIAVGRNGRVWVDSGSVKETLVVGKALQETDQACLGLDDQKRLVRRLLKGS